MGARSKTTARRPGLDTIADGGRRGLMMMELAEFLWELELAMQEAKMHVQRNNGEGWGDEHVSIPCSFQFLT